MAAAYVHVTDQAWIKPQLAKTDPPLWLAQKPGH